MSTIAERPNLSLFGVETQLIELLAFREELLSDPDLQGAEREESLQATENRILEYLQKHIQKVDGVAHYLREFQARAEIAKREAERCKAREKMWEARYDRLKTMVESVMIQTGQKRLEGQGNTLSLRKCPPSVEIAQPELVPDDYAKVALTMPVDLWRKIVECLDDPSEQGNATLFDRIAVEVSAKPSEPMKAKIAEALEQIDPCEKCHATGHLQVPITDLTPNGTIICLTCEGTGKVNRGVPGCSLVSEKMYLKVS